MKLRVFAVQLEWCIKGKGGLVVSESFAQAQTQKGEFGVSCIVVV